MKKGLCIIGILIILAWILQRAQQRRGEALTNAEVAFLKQRKQQSIGLVFTSDEVERLLFGEANHEA